jgi:hypothetical protein
MMEIPVPRMRKAFSGDTPWGARAAASKWLSDFSDHGPLHIRSIRVIEIGEAFEAVVTYSAMRLDSEMPKMPAAPMPMLKAG